MDGFSRSSEIRFEYEYCSGKEAIEKIRRYYTEKRMSEASYATFSYIRIYYKDELIFEFTDWLSMFAHGMVIGLKEFLEKGHAEISAHDDPIIFILDKMDGNMVLFKIDCWREKREIIVKEAGIVEAILMFVKDFINEILNIDKGLVEVPDISDVVLEIKQVEERVKALEGEINEIYPNKSIRG